MKLNYESCAAAAAKFNTQKDLREQANSEFQWLKRSGRLQEACVHMQRLRRSFSDDDIAAIAAKYITRRAFKLGDQSAYNAAWSRGILDTVCAHMNNERYRILSDEQIADKALGFDSRSAFYAGDSGAYQTAVKRGILQTVCAHMPKGTRRLTNSQLLAIAVTYKTRNDFKLGDFGAYTTAIRRGIITEASEHMEPGSTGFREDMPAVLYQFRVVTGEGLVLYKVGITNRKPRQRLTTMGLLDGAKGVLMHAVEFACGRDARMAEKRLHREFAKHRYCGQPVLKNGNTELFLVPVIEC